MKNYPFYYYFYFYVSLLFLLLKRNKKYNNNNYKVKEAMKLLCPDVNELHFEQLFAEKLTVQFQCYLFVQ